MRRPKLHFTAQRGFLNDPNGLVYIDGSYHMFYQHYPADVYWGPMHWGHAVSRDLLHWEHLPIALYPDENGYIFSGSCFYDAKNISGLGTADRPPLLAYYTSHDPASKREEQCLAYSTDYVRFQKYGQNPVMERPQSKDFRDPKVYGLTDGRFGCVVAAGEKLVFYQSKDLLRWEECGEFSPADYGFSGVCECPDCIRFETEKGERWVLSFSLILPDQKVKTPFDFQKGEYTDSHAGLYFVGQFDGRTFLVDQTQQKQGPYLLDCGADCYAAVSFQNIKGKYPIMIGWAENWNRVNDMPAVAGICRGKMTLARTLSLTETERGLRLRAKPVIPGMYADRIALRKNEAYTFHPMQPLIAVCDMEGSGQIKIFNGEDEQVVLSVTQREIALATAHRTELRAGRLRFGICRIMLIYDEGVLEVYAEDGLTVFTQNVYPVNPFTRILYRSGG